MRKSRELSYVELFAAFFQDGNGLDFFFDFRDVILEFPLEVFEHFVNGKSMGVQNSVFLSNDESLEIDQ